MDKELKRPTVRVSEYNLRQVTDAELVSIIKTSKAGANCSGEHKLEAGVDFTCPMHNDDGCWSCMASRVHGKSVLKDLKKKTIQLVRDHQ